MTIENKQGGGRRERDPGLEEEDKAIRQWISDLLESIEIGLESEMKSERDQYEIYKQLIQRIQKEREQSPGLENKTIRVWIKRLLQEIGGLYGGLEDENKQTREFMKTVESLKKDKRELNKKLTAETTRANNAESARKAETTRANNAESARKAETTRANNAESARKAETTRANNAESARKAETTRANNAESARKAETTRANNAESARKAQKDRADELEQENKHLHQDPNYKLGKDGKWQRYNGHEWQNWNGHAWESPTQNQNFDKCRKYAEAAAKFSDKERVWIDNFIANTHKSEGGYADVGRIRGAIKLVDTAKLKAHSFMSAKEFNKIQKNGKKKQRACENFRDFLSERQADIVEYVEAKGVWEKEKHRQFEELMQAEDLLGKTGKNDDENRYKTARDAIKLFENELIKAKMDVANMRPKNVLKGAWKGIGKGWRWLGDQNLSNTRLFKDSDNKFIRGLGRAASLRTAIGAGMFGVAGIGFLAGASAVGGVGTAVGTGFTANREMNWRQKGKLFRNFKNEIKAMQNDESKDSKTKYKRVTEMYREITEFVGKQNNKELLEDKEYKKVQEDYVSFMAGWLKGEYDTNNKQVTKKLFGEISHMDREAQKKAEEAIKKNTRKRILHTAVSAGLGGVGGGLLGGGGIGS